MNGAAYTREGYANETVPVAEWLPIDADEDKEMLTNRYDRGNQTRTRAKHKPRKVGRLDPTRLETIEKRFRPRQQSPAYSAAAPATPPHAPNPMLQPGVRFHSFLLNSLHWVLSTAGTVFNMLQIPIAIGMSLLIIYLVSDAILVASKPTICLVPGISSLEICDLPSIPPEPTIPAAVQNALEYSSKLEEMQILGANSVELPYYLGIAEGGIRGMIIQMSAVDLPTKQKLMPMLREYSDLAQRSIDGLQDWLARIDQVVDRTILINSWAESSLHRVEERDASLMAPINNLVNKVFGVSIGGMKSEAEVRQAFFGLTNQVQEQASKVILEAQRQRGDLIELKAILDSIAIAVLGDKHLLRQEKMSKKVYWKWILREYRNQMSDFDAKMEMCAEFYKHTQQAITVISTTQLKLQQMRGQLIVFRDGLQDGPLMLDGGKTVPLRLYIDTLKAGIDNLETTRTATRQLKADKMRELEQGILKH